MEIIKTVGVAFIKEGKLLIVQSVRSAQTHSWTLIGGGVETNETLEQAACREVAEEIGNGFTISETDLAPILGFKQEAASDESIMIEMHVYLCQKAIDVELVPNKEILAFHWYSLGEIERNLSSSITENIIPYGIENNLLY